MTERAIAVLTVLATHTSLRGGEGMTPNDIAHKIGFRTGQDANRHARDGRAMGPAQRVIFPLTTLKKAGHVDMTRRADGLSGTAYIITTAGRAALKEAIRP